MARPNTPAEETSLFALKVAGTPSYSASDLRADRLVEHLSNIERADARVILINESRRALLVDALLFYAQYQSSIDKEAA